MKKSKFYYNNIENSPSVDIDSLETNVEKTNYKNVTKNLENYQEFELNKKQELLENFKKNICEERN